MRMNWILFGLTVIVCVTMLAVGLYFESQRNKSPHSPCHRAPSAIQLTNQ